MTFQTKAPTLAFYGADTASFEVQGDQVAQTPRGRVQRLARAALEALPIAVARRDEALAQTDEDAIVLVCAVDCEIGRSIIAAKLGADVTKALDVMSSLTGPCVFAVQPQWLINAFAQGKEIADSIAKLEAKPGEMVWAFAVNGKQLDLRVMRPAKEETTPFSEGS